MIIYIASYPRSGNSWVKQLVRHHFQRLTSTIYPSNNPLGFDTWNLRPAPKAPMFRRRNKLWNEWTALYETELPPKSTHRFLMPGCGEMLTVENRKRLALEEEHFFLKIHELPFPQYFEGEYVIQPVRSVGATLWSYYNFILDTEPSEKHQSLTQIIQGDVLFGSWSDYHMQWYDTVSKLGDRYLRIKYEWLSENALECCTRIGELTGLKFFKRESITFEELHAKNKVMYREGKAYGWEINYSRDQLRLLWEIHGRAMEYLGYSVD